MNAAIGQVSSNGGPPNHTRMVAASAVRAFVAWLTTRGETVHAGALEPSDVIYRATLQFLRERGLEHESYNPDWLRSLDG